MDEQVTDPVLTRLLRHRTGLKAGGRPGEPGVMATYWTAAGETPFAFCRHGLLLDPGPGERFIPFAEVADAGYYNSEMIERAKAARAAQAPGAAAPLVIRLFSGERVTLPVEIRDDGMPDLLTIASLINQRAAIHGAGRGRP
jgi:hypothetical protein